MSAAAQVLPMVDATTYPPIQSKAPPKQPSNNQQQKSAPPNTVPPKNRPRPGEERKDTGGKNICNNLKIFIIILEYSNYL